jgi:hypothetical protein
MVRVCGLQQAGAGAGTGTARGEGLFVALEHGVPDSSIVTTDSISSLANPMLREPVCSLAISYWLGLGQFTVYYLMIPVLQSTNSYLQSTEGHD